MAKNNGGEPTDWSDKADRYRQAAERALGQLDWVVDYLYSIARPTSRGRSPRTVHPSGGGWPTVRKRKGPRRSDRSWDTTMSLWNARFEVAPE